MANVEITTAWPANFWVNDNQPLDAKTIFNTLEELDEQLPGNIRFKGQKFVIKNPPIKDSPNGEPKEYWFIEDYIKPGNPKVVWTKEDKNYGIDPDSEDYDWDFYFETYGDDYWDDDDWKEVSDPPEFVPQPVLYQPGGEAQQIELPPLGGDVLPAFADETNNVKGLKLFEFEGDELADDTEEKKEFTINNYADRAPNAPTLNFKQFKKIPNEPSYDGTYYVK